MSQTPEWPPTAEAMHSLLPAFEFTSMVTSNDLGAVFFANQKSLERQVAVKVFSPALSSDQAFREPFEASSKLAAGLRHPNLIGIIDSGEAGGLPYLVMEFVPGKSLARSTRGQIVEFDQSVSIIEAICAGLAHAHDAGLVHGHLDTLSILLNQHAVPKIGNFGFGRIVHTDPDTKAPRHFIAPEVLIEPSAATKASDVFSAAAIFHELITGQPYSPASPPPSTVCGCRKTVDTVLKQATDPDPGKRHADAAAFLDALSKAAEAPRQVAASANAKANTNANTNATPLPVPESGAGSKLLIKLALIVVLIFAILFTWETLKKTRLDREKQNQEILAKEKARKEERAAAQAAADKAIADSRQRQDSPAPAVDTPSFEPELETPAESLSRLRSALASGSRSEMPAGSVNKGDRIYFLVEQPMAWVEAALFAEEHGAYLAAPDTDLSWLNDEFTKGRECWLGAVRESSETWALCHGLRWSPPQQPSGSGRFLISGEKGGLASADGQEPRPFVIEWRADGSNPGSLASQLAATRASLDGDAPLFPPGTIKSGLRRYLFVPRPVTWQEAGKLAEDGGGHLLVAASPEEIADLTKLTDPLNASDGIWLGGSLEGDHWLWITGEPWQAAAWAADSDASGENSALAIRPGSGWVTMDRGDTASGFLIEWSPDKNAPKPGATAPAPGEKIAELDARVKELVAAAARESDEEFAANIKKFRWDIDAFLRGLARSAQAQFAPSVQYLKDAVEDNRLLIDQIKENWSSGTITVSPEMAKLLNYHSDKENEIDAKFAADVAKIRDAYVAKLTEIRDEAKASGQIKISSNLDETIRKTADLAPWLASLGVAFDPNRKKNESDITADKQQEPDKDRERDPLRDGLSEEEQERVRDFIRDRLKDFDNQ